MLIIFPVIILLFFILIFPTLRKSPKQAISKTLNTQGVENIEECLLWAFGEGFGSAPLASLNDRWNTLHSDLFIIKGSDNFLESFKRIGNAYKRHKE